MSIKDVQVLLVEDEFDTQQMVSKILTHNGAVVTVVSDGQACLEKLKTMRPQLVVMDLSMPNMDGWQTISKLRANPETASLPVVAITAYHSDEVEQGVTDAGFNAYFRKPVSAKTFVNDIDELIAR
jgi:CheY-like chemotaxis protein